MCPALVVTGARWRRASGVGRRHRCRCRRRRRPTRCAGSGRRRHRRRHRRGVAALAAGDGGSDGGGDGRGGETKKWVAGKGRGRRRTGMEKMQKPRRARRFVGGQYAAMNAYYIYL